MSHPVPFVRIDHHNKNKNAFRYDVVFILSKSTTIKFKCYQYEKVKKSLKEEDLIPWLDDHDYVVEHSYNPKTPSDWSPAWEDRMGGWFNSRKMARFSDNLPAGNKVLVMAHPDSSPSNKRHNGTIHFPYGIT